MAKQFQQRVQQQQQYQGIKTRKFRMEPAEFTKIAMSSSLKKLWWAFLIPIAIIAPGLYWMSALPWLLGTAVILTVLFVGLMYVFFKNFHTLPQGKMLFEKVAFYIDNQSMKVMVSEQEGMEVKYDLVKRLEVHPGKWVLFLSPVQFFIIPHTLFQSENDFKLAENILKRRGLIPSSNTNGLKA